jgi:hypothetical protein
LQCLNFNQQKKPYSFQQVGQSAQWLPTALKPHSVENRGSALATARGRRYPPVRAHGVAGSLIPPRAFFRCIPARPETVMPASLCRPLPTWLAPLRSGAA